MVALQREAAGSGDWITEGRDQGTVVFPDAECKFFLDAILPVRANRRRSDLVRAGKIVSIEDVTRDLEERDQRDRERETSPLRPAHNAMMVDTSGLTLEQVVSRLEITIKAKRAATAK